MFKCYIIAELVLLQNEINFNISPIILSTGVGKGLVGAITRPASGVIDFASYSFDGIRRFYSLLSEISTLFTLTLFY